MTTVVKKNSKSRHGCLTCKKKRLKCDETKPECLNCSKKGIACGGYATNFKWKSFEEIASKKRKACDDNVDADASDEKSNNVKMKRSMSVPDSVKFEEAFRQATLSISGKTPSQIAQPEINSYHQSRCTGASGTSLHSSSNSLPSVSEIQSKHSNGSSPTLSTMIRAFTDFQQFNIPSPSNLDLSSTPASLSNTSLIESAIVDEDAEFFHQINIQAHPGNQMKRGYSMDSSLSGASLPQYRKELLSFSQSLNSRTSPTPSTYHDDYYINIPSTQMRPNSFTLQTPQELLKSINLSTADFNNLLNTFNKYTSSIMSIKNGPTENPWRTLIYPLSLKYPMLFKAIVSMSSSHLLQLRNDEHMKNLSHEYMSSSMQELAEGLSKNTIPNEVALATSIALAMTDAWKSGGKSSGVLHLRGARSIMKKIKPQEIQQNVEIYEFLFNTFIYMDVMCRLSNVGIVSSADVIDESILTITDNINLAQESENSVNANEKTSPNSSTDSFMDPLISENFLPPRRIVNDNHLIDPLLGISKSLFLIIGKVATFISKVKNLSKLSLHDISTAVKFKSDIESWKPNPLVIKESLLNQSANQDRTENKDVDISSCIATAEAYRFSTLLYLQQVVPEISSQRSSDLADKILMLLASIPTCSRTLILHIFPMLVASCEIEDEGDREWILERWNVLNEKLWLSNVSQAVEIIKEVWKRKDSLRKKSLETKANGMAEGDDWDLFQSRIDTLVGFRKRSEKGANDWTHWSTVMKDWNLELVFG